MTIRFSKISLYTLLIFLAEIELLLAQGSTVSQGAGSLTEPYQNGISWKRSVVSAGLLVGTVTGIYLSTRPIYYDEKTVSLHFSRNPDGSLKIFENEDRGLDKFGHIFTASLFSRNLIFLSRWSDFSENTSAYLGSILSIVVMTSMELHDAFYQRWGFSIGDCAGNIVGGVWPAFKNESGILRSFYYKMSYNFLAEKSDDAYIQDYENMHFWLSVNPKGLMGKALPDWFPGFLNIACGVGVSSYSMSRREIYLGLDYNLSAIHSKSFLLRHLISLLDKFHFPAPAIRIHPGYVGYGLFF
jgi:hypothetical protein